MHTGEIKKKKKKGGKIPDSDLTESMNAESSSSGNKI